jgi:hypothetical protein
MMKQVADELLLVILNVALITAVTDSSALAAVVAKNHRNRND